MKIHKWEGGDCPVDEEALVVCKLLCGAVTRPTPAGKLIWERRFAKGVEHQGNIRAWRMAS